MKTNFNKKEIIGIIVAAILLFVFIILGTLVVITNNIKNPFKSGDSSQIEFTIERGDGARKIADKLGRQGIIKSPIFFNIYITYKKVSGNLKAGKYLLSPSMAIPEIANKFVSGDVEKNKISILEGWNLRDIGNYFENQGLFKAEELFYKAGFPAVDYEFKNALPIPKDYSEEFQFLKDKPTTVGLEGYIFPDTYEADSNETIDGLLKKALANFDAKLTLEMREEIKKQGKSIFEIITMASLIEKEVRIMSDKKMVSGVLWGRLKIDMPLQVDSTVLYASPKQNARVLKEDLLADSRFNTYKYKGLPLGPICNPGIDSIKAAIYPTKNNYLYYLSTPTGRTIFSRTLTEHNIAKAKYLK